MESNIYLLPRALAQSILQNLRKSKYISNYLTDVSVSVIESPLETELPKLINSLVRNKDNSSRLPFVGVTMSPILTFSNSKMSMINEITISEVGSNIEIPYHGSTSTVKVTFQVMIITREFASSLKLQELVRRAIKGSMLLEYPIAIVDKSSGDTLWYCENCGKAWLEFDVEADTQHNVELDVYVTYFTVKGRANVFDLEEMTPYLGLEDDLGGYCLKGVNLIDGKAGEC